MPSPCPFPFLPLPHHPLPSMGPPILFGISRRMSVPKLIPPLVNPSLCCQKMPGLWPDESIACFSHFLLPCPSSKYEIGNLGHVFAAQKCPRRFIITAALRNKRRKQQCSSSCFLGSEMGSNRNGAWRFPGRAQVSVGAIGAKHELK